MGHDEWKNIRAWHGLDKGEKIQMASQKQYDNLAIHFHMVFDRDIEDAYYDARIILTMLGFRHDHLDEHLVNETPHNE